MPLVIILDPHGSGSYAIKYFIASAESYRCVMAASNVVRNNYGGFIQTIQALINDVKTRYPVGDRIYLAGFSGGARMALTFAQGHRVNGILACGALATPEQLTAISSNVFAITGMADFNFPEAARYILDEAGKPSNLKIELSGEMHQWPDSRDISMAMGSLMFADDFGDNRCIQKKEMLKEFSSNYKKIADSLYEKSRLLNASMVCSNALNTEGLPDAHYFKGLLESINNNSLLKEEISQLRKSLQFEFKVRDAYYNALTTKDIGWWTNELADLNAHIENIKDIHMNYAYRRIKAFLGIVCYSITNNAFGTNDLISAAKILEIYKLVEPKNPDMYYFSALYALKTGNDKLVTDYIKLAVENGFENIGLLKNEFPAKFLKEVKISER